MPIRTLYIIALFIFPTLTLANIDWDPAKRVPIRTKTPLCQALLAPNENGRVNDSVGIPISTANTNDFKEKMKEALQNGLVTHESLKGSQLFITGVSIPNEKQTENAFQTALVDLGFVPNDIAIKILSIPEPIQRKITLQAAKQFLQRFFYWFPSVKRDYQTPRLREVLSGLASNAVVETPNIVLLYQHLPTLDANTTVITHVALITLYTIYKKFITNWVLRPDSNGLELFFKQMALSFPFVLNFNVSGSLSEILNFYKFHGWAATQARFPHELAKFAETQTFTILLQTLFYNIVIARGVRAWENSQTGNENSELAREVANYITIPILALDAIVLTQASSHSQTIFEYGAFQINHGHLSLVALTATGSILALKPHLLDPTLKWYRSTARFLDPAVCWVRRIVKKIFKPSTSQI